MNLLSKQPHQFSNTIAPWDQRKSLKFEMRTSFQSAASFKARFTIALPTIDWRNLQSLEIAGDLSARTTSDSLPESELNRIRDELDVAIAEECMNATHVLAMSSHVVRESTPPISVSVSSYRHIKHLERK